VRSVSLSVTRLHCAKTAEPIEVSFGVETLWDLGHIVLEEGSDSPLARMDGFDAAFAQFLWRLVYVYYSS